MTKQDSIFPNVSLPGGISTKATEFRELAAKGDKWESPVFGIGSAKESSDVPKLTQISRKPHTTAGGTVKGGNHPGSAAESGGYSSGTTEDMSSGMGSGMNSGMGSGTGNEYGSKTTDPVGSDAPTGTSGFSNQVDQAFDNKGTAPTTNGTTSGGTASYYSNVTA